MLEKKTHVLLFYKKYQTDMYNVIYNLNDGVFNCYQVINRKLFPLRWGRPKLATLPLPPPLLFKWEVEK